MNQTIFDDFKPLVICGVMVMNITMNVLVIAVIAKYSQLREDRTTLFIISLTLSGLANGCTTMPISAAVCTKATPNVQSMLPYVPRVLQVCTVWFSYTSVHKSCCVTVCNMIGTAPILTTSKIKPMVPYNSVYMAEWCISVHQSES